MTLTQHLVTELDVQKIRKHDEDLIAFILEEAKKRGATQAEVDLSQDVGFTANVRLGEVDTVEHHRNKGIAITVYFEQRKGSASTTDTDKTAVINTLDKACNIARFTEADSCSGLADKNLMATDIIDLDLWHPWNITTEQAIDIALQCEAKGMQVDKRISNSEGASVNTHQGIYAYGNSHGFMQSYPVSRHSLSLALIAKVGDSMQRDYSYSVTRDPNLLESMDFLAEDAAQKTLARLNPQRIKTQKCPVIFSHELAPGLIGHFLSAIRGGNIYRKSSFLVDKLQTQIFPSFLNITEKPHIKGALASHAFDSEGVKTYEKDLIRDGILQTYLLGSYSARKLGLKTTANAGGVSNIYLTTQDLDQDALLKKMDKGLLLTELMGQGANLVTGDYSRGASGFWVEGGKIQYPVEEITIAGNLPQMYSTIVAVGNDFNKNSSIHTGSILLNEMMVAGI